MQIDTTFLENNLDYQFATKCRQGGGFNSRDLLVDSSKGQDSFWRLGGATSSRPLCWRLVAPGRPRCSLANRWHSLYLHSDFPPHLSVSVQISPFYKNTGPIGLGNTLMTSSKLCHLQRPYFQISSHHRYWGLELRHRNSPITPG